MNVRVENINAELGAVVHLNRSDLCHPETTELLLSLLEKRTFVVLPKIGLTDEEQLARTDRLGKLSAEEQGDLHKLRVVHTVTAAVREFAAPDALDDARRTL